MRVFTTAGSFVIELDRGRAPLTVEAFLGYVTAGFYNGTIFHRVVAGFVAQTGGYTATFQQKTTTKRFSTNRATGSATCAARSASRARTSRIPERVSSTSTSPTTSI